MTRCDIEKLKADMELQYKKRAKIRKRLRKLKDVVQFSVALLAATALFCVVGAVEYGQVDLRHAVIIMGIASLVLWLSVKNIR